MVTKLKVFIIIILFMSVIDSHLNVNFFLKLNKDLSKFKNRNLTETYHEKNAANKNIAGYLETEGNIKSDNYKIEQISTKIIEKPNQISNSKFNDINILTDKLKNDIEKSKELMNTDNNFNENNSKNLNKSFNNNKLEEIQNKNMNQDLNNYILKEVINKWSIFTNNKNNYIGKGSFGKVYKIKFKNSKIFAFKCQQNKKQFIREYNINRYLLNNGVENIINVINIYKKNEQMCILSDYYEYTLDKYVNKLDNINNKNISILEILDKLILTAGSIHNLNIAHRDLKPENILVDKNGNPFIADFGSAGIISGYLKYNYKGTWLYSPLHKMGNFLKYIPKYTDLKKLDYFALGVLLYILKNKNIKQLYKSGLNDPELNNKYQLFINEWKEFNYDQSNPIPIETSIKIYIKELILSF